MRFFSLAARILLSLLFVSMAFYLTSQPVNAATYTVTKTADTNDGTCDADCSLREAVAAANGNTGNDTINFNIGTGDGGYVAPSGGTQGYWQLTLNSSISLTDNAGATINGYSQTGATRNTAVFGQPMNAVLTVRLYFNDDTYQLGFNLLASNNNHLTGLNMVKKRTNSSSRYDFNNASNNWIEGNYFGSTITGTAADAGNAIRLSNGSSTNTIGTNGDNVGDAGERNLFAGSEGDSGVIMFWDATSINNVVAGNYMGTINTGRTCSGATVFRTQVLVQSAGNRIGTNYDGVSDSEESNIIGCVNNTYRASIRVLVGANTVIQGNYLGVSPQGDALGTMAGQNTPQIELSGTDLSGGLVKGNIISNGAYGIKSATSNRNRFSQNSIYGNEFLGISLSGTTQLANDPGDVDTGVNDLMNYPVLTKVVRSGNNLLVTANLDFKASEGPFIIELFTNNTVNSSGRAEGQFFVGSVTTSTIGTNVTLVVPITGTNPSSGSLLTATATNSLGSTSEFSMVPSDGTIYTAGSQTITYFDNQATNGPDGKNRLFGTAVSSNYNVSNIITNVNGGSWQTASALDGSFDSPIERFYVDFLPTDNGNKLDGFTILAQTQDSSNVWSNKAVFMSPFVVTQPTNRASYATDYPAISFQVAPQTAALKHSLSQYQVLIRPLTPGAAWDTLIEGIPINQTNINNRTYETAAFVASYSPDFRQVTVYSKAKSLRGNVEMKVVAVDTAGRTQETSTQQLFDNNQAVPGFPLAVVNIGGVNTPSLSTTNLAQVKTNYTTSSGPRLYGIAYSGAQISATATEQQCQINCTQTFTTTATGSRFSIQVPAGSFKSGKKYIVSVAAELNQQYTQLPALTLAIR